MKAVFCIYDGENIINGINAWMLQLLPALIARDIEVRVIYIASAPEQQCTVIPLLKQHGIKCIIIPYPHYTEKEIRWILRYINIEKPDVFIPGNMLSALYASKWINKAGIATIGILHNDDLEYAAITQEFIAIKNDHLLTAVIAVSAALYLSIARYSRHIKIYTIPYGAPVPQAKASYKTSQVFKIVYTGRIVQEQKRISEVTTAFCECAQQLKNVELYIYGSGPDIDIMDAILHQYNYPSNVFIMGNIPNNEIHKKLLDSHCIVLMSDYEGIPVSLMEAMACGVVPVCKKITWYS